MNRRPELPEECIAGEHYLRERQARTEPARVNRERKQLWVQLAALEEGGPRSGLAEQS
jgi:hypothetical protein